MAFGWPLHVDRNGTPASGVIEEKRENIRVRRYGERDRRFELVASYSISGRTSTRHAVCDVDEKAFDSLRVGDSVAVHYFPALFVQSFVTADHLAPCSPLASTNFFSSSASKPLAVALLPLLAILLLWRLFRIRSAAWLLLPWMFFALTYLVLPRVEAEPGRPVLATAQVDWVDDITALGLSRRRGEYIPLGNLRNGAPEVPAAWKPEVPAAWKRYASDGCRQARSQLRRSLLSSGRSGKRSV